MPNWKHGKVFQLGFAARILLFVSFLFLFQHVSFGQTTLAHFGLNNNLSADIDNVSGTPSANHSDLTFSSNNECEGSHHLYCRGTGDYLEITINTSGYSTINITWQQRDYNSSNGRWNFIGDYDNNGTTDFSSTSHSTVTSSCGTVSISLPTDFNNQNNIRLRFTSSNATGSQYFYIDDIAITGTLSTSPPSCASLIFPTDNATDVAADGTLTWGTVAGATSYRIYFGTDATATNIENGTDLGNVTSYTPSSNLEFLTDYYWKIIPYNSYGEATGCSIWSFTTEDISYCSSFGNTEWDDGITLVNFNTINNSSGKPDGYSDYTYLSTDVIQGNSYNLTVNLNTDGNYTNYAIAWIDWDQDGEFNTSTEQYSLGTASNIANGATILSPLSIEIPSNASSGTTLMRVSTQYDQDPQQCGEDFDGEVEDYSINITSSCYNPTNGGTIAADQSICSGDDPVVFTSSVNASGETGNLEYKWQYSTADSPYSWQDAGATGLTYNDNTPLTADRWYKRLARVTCESDWTGAAESNVLKVTVNDKPIIAGITSPTALCAHSSLSITVPSVTTNGSTITAQGWQLETGVATGFYTNITIPYIVAYADYGKRIRYYATNSCGTTNGAEVPVTVNPLPSAASFGSNNDVCDGDNAVFTISGTAGNVVTYDGAISGTVTIGSGGTVDVTVENVTVPDVTLNLTNVSNGTCDLPLSVSSTITVNPLPIILGPFD